MTKVLRLPYYTLLFILLLQTLPLSQGASWKPPKNPGFTGKYALNSKLKEIDRLGKFPEGGPESIAFDSTGILHTGDASGKIFKYTENGQYLGVLAHTRGRPLGMKFDKEENLIVCDGYRGLLSISPAGEILTLATQAAGKAFKFTDDLDIAEDGTVYFSDASHRYDLHKMINDILDHDPNGRLLVYRPQTGKVEVLIDKLFFANGVALGPEDDYLLIAESTKYRILRYWLKGEKRGQLEVFIDNLPGHPDNLTFNGTDTFWVALYAPRNSLLDKLLPWPILRKGLKYIPSFLRPKPKAHGIVLGLDLEGKVVANLQDKGRGAYSFITSAIEYQGNLYLGSFKEEAIGKIALP